MPSNATTTEVVDNFVSGRRELGRVFVVPGFNLADCQLAVLAAGISLLENEFVAPRRAAVGMQTSQGEAAGTVEIEDLLRRGNFKRISADPVDHVLPQTHTPKLLVFADGTERVAQEEVLEQASPPHHDK